MGFPAVGGQRRPATSLLLVAMSLVMGVTGCQADRLTDPNAELSEEPGAGPGNPSAASEPVLIAAAAVLREAFTVLGESFDEGEVVFTFGSSGQLAQQILEGAPYDLFASADASYIDGVIESGLGESSTRAPYALGRIAIWSRRDRWADWGDLTDVLGDSRVSIIAIANPDHAPYGRAARQALTAEGLWEAAQDRLVFGTNIADAHRLAASGNADVAITALALAVGDSGSSEGQYELVDERLHDTLEQQLVVLDTGQRRSGAERFVEHLLGEQGRTVMREFGFRLPGNMAPGLKEDDPTPVDRQSASSRQVPIQAGR